MRMRPDDAPAPGIALLPLLLALAIMLGLTVYPLVLQGRGGHPDYLVATLLCWAMSAGFTRGVGLLPRRRLLRLLLGTPAALLATAAAVMLLVRGI